MITFAHIMKYVLSVSRKVILHLVTTCENLTATLVYRKVFIPNFLQNSMTETFSIEIEMPEFMSLMEAEAKKRILEEVNTKIRDKVAKLAVKTAREIIAQKLDIVPSTVSEEPAEAQEIEESRAEMEQIDKRMEIKSSLAEEILSLSEEDALRKLKLSLAKGEIDGDTFQELKALVEPVTTNVAICPQCGKELEPTVNFCRFCGARVK